MPTYAVQFRRGTTIEHTTFIGSEGEITVNTDDSTLRLHDGETAGGFAFASAASILTDISQYTDEDGILLGTGTIASDVPNTVTNYAAYTKALVSTNADGSAVEDKTGTHTLVNSGVTASNTAYKYATASMYFDGSSYLQIPAHEDLVFGVRQPFTLETWVYPTDSTNDTVLIAQDNGTSSRQGFRLTRKSTGIIEFLFWNGIGRSSSDTLLSTSSVAENEWTHLAVSYDGQTVRLFVNGVEHHSKTPQPFLYSSNQHITFGSTTDGASTNKFIGYLEDVRMINGVSVYSADFTVPTTTLTYVLPGGPTAGWYGDRMVVHVGGRISAGASNALEYFDITTPGNASSFGTATVSTYYRGSCSNGTYGIWAGGGAQYGVDWTAAIDYVTIATTGQATTFGSATSGYSKWSGASDGTYGLFAGAERISYHYSLIEYITIATSGTAANFGDRTIEAEGAGSVSNGTYNIMAGGYHSNNFGTFYNVIDYVSYATPGTADDFGDLTTARYALVGAGDLTRGLFAGSGTTVDYITMDTPGNATDWGDMLNSREFAAGASNGTYALIAGGNPQASDRLTIQTLGSATSFGSLQSFPVEGSSGCSGSPS